MCSNKEAQLLGSVFSMRIKLHLKTLLSVFVVYLSCVPTITYGEENFMISRDPVDTLVYAGATEPVGLDPAFGFDIESNIIYANIYEGLLRFKENSTDVEPCLAESYEISDDRLQYTFHLRKGVLFHDGTELDANAVKASFERQLPQNAHPGMTYSDMVFAVVDVIEVVDKYTVRITLKEPVTPFLRNIAMYYATPIVSPAALKKYGNNLNEHPVGTGPYRFIRWDKEQQIILTRNDRYWGKHAHIPNLIFRTVPDVSARVIALLNGELDITADINIHMVNKIRSGGMHVLAQDSKNSNFLVFNCLKESPASDPEIRKAVCAAINVKELTRTLFKDYAIAMKTLLPKGIEGFSENIHTYTDYNPEYARRIFKEKGIHKLKILTYSVSKIYNSEGGQVLAEAAQAYLKQVGVDSEITSYDWANFRAHLLLDEWDLAFRGWITDNGDPDNFMTIFEVNDRANNSGMWQNDEFDALVQKARQTPFGKERELLYQKAEAVIAEDIPILPLFSAKLLRGINPHIHGYQIEPTGYTCFWKITKKGR